MKVSELPDEQAITRDSWTVLRNTLSSSRVDMRAIAVGAMTRPCFPRRVRAPAPVEPF